MLKHSLHILNSGLEVIKVPMQGLPSVTVLVMGGTGSRYEDPDQQGLAHFFEHMVFKGTKNYPSAKILAETIDAVGAETNAFTSKEFTGYYIKIKSDRIKLALDVLSDMLFLPILPEEEIIKEKRVIIEEMHMYHDAPMRDVGNLFDSLFFVDQTLGHDVIGTKKTVLNLKRSNFLEFLKRWYGLENLTLVLAGDAHVLESPRLLVEIEKLFEAKAAGQNRHKGRIDTAQLLGRPPLSTRRLKIRRQDTKQVHLMLGWPGYARSDSRRHALSLLANILGGNMSSRLFTEVREKRGLCYYVNAGPDYFHETGTLAVAAGVDPKRTHEAISVILDECQSLLVTKPITAKELAKAKENIIGNMALSFEDSQAVAQYFGLKQVLMRHVETPRELIDKIRSLTLDEVHTVVQEIVDAKQLRLCLIGAFDASEFKQYIV